MPNGILDLALLNQYYSLQMKWNERSCVLVLQSVFELLCGFRMARPMWLNMTSDSTDAKARAELSKQLVQDLGYLLSTLDTKNTNLWVATQGWVETSTYYTTIKINFWAPVENKWSAQMTVLFFFFCGRQRIIWK